MKLKQLMDQEAKNRLVLEPMKQANEEIKWLEKINEEFIKIKAKLEDYKLSI